jgi:hypothetical protein
MKQKRGVKGRNGKRWSNPIEVCVNPRSMERETGQERGQVELADKKM